MTIDKTTAICDTRNMMEKLDAQTFLSTFVHLHTDRDSICNVYKNKTKKTNVKQYKVFTLFNVVFITTTEKE